MKYANTDAILSGIIVSKKSLLCMLYVHYYFCIINDNNG
ncbi:unnamed protein product [Schistosoma curassoni]|uniref:Uncharacterized protein n=1 Tax=Schistosoma curassoni TaxID=6186 RepID=A0A183L2Z3_9TREM|nr:unnamed protein product [Schistosoma curassoni]